jgi:ATP-dependent exoDNAse (exonuclease V) beta subunit
VVTFTEKAARELTTRISNRLNELDIKFNLNEMYLGNQIEDAVVQAKKEFAQQIAVASGMEYRMIKASDANERHYRMLL